MSLSLSLFSKFSKKKRTKDSSLEQAADEGVEARYRPIDASLTRRLLTWLLPFKWSYIIGIGLGVLMMGGEMMGPQYIRAIINGATSGETPRYIRAIINFFGPGERMGPVLMTNRAKIHWILGVVAIWGATLAIVLVLQRGVILIVTKAGEKVQFNIRRALFAQLQRLSMSYYDKTKLGRIISRCTSDIGSLRQINVWGLYHFMLYTFQMVFAAVMMMLFTDWRLFASVAWLGVVLMVVSQIYRKKMGFMYQVVREGWTRVSTNLAENITGVRVVTAFHRQVPNLGRFNNLQVVNTANNVQAARVNALYQPLLQFIGVLGKAIILTYGAYLLLCGKLAPGPGLGSVVAAFLYWDHFIGPIMNFGNLHNQLMQAMAGAERVFNLLDIQPEVQDAAEAKPLPRIAGRVQFEHVTFGYNPDRPVLHDVNFEAHPGQMIALVGHTGCGKSTIVSLIARFYQPQQGRVLVDGHDIRYVTGDSLHKQMGLVLQTNYLFSGTVLDNIRYARPEATDAQVIEASRAIGSHEAIMSLQNGFQTEVGERGANMSLGQRQLICFTRAFLADPRIFMLDEATSAVDTATELIVQHSLERLLEGRTTFIVAHRLSTIMRADCILVVDHGKIIERGTHRELINLDGKYAQLYEQFVTQAE